MGDIALLKDAIQMETVFNCFKEFVAHFSKEEKEFAAHINQDDCQQYAFDMLLPIYKVCEGFAGKVVPDNLKQLAQEVCDRIRKAIGMENFALVYSNIRTNLKVRREKRKREEKVMAVTKPVQHAKRKLQVAAKNRAHKKRKIMTMKTKMGSRTTTELTSSTGFAVDIDERTGHRNRGDDAWTEFCGFCRGCSFVILSLSEYQITWSYCEPYTRGYVPLGRVSGLDHNRRNESSARSFALVLFLKLRLE
ncbi:hypothetical protein OIU74_001113 [Salix koriyanagi]|uniref:U3 small nucleolar RNA-associated protein 20 C-terminal domain-containing protein n=1 Tax=Salix koriyanagi TaxID=2511006 RepID=A0A9Q1AN28_9ROSI|nr:hypothetical protein OIU74_001113 [Salix koriyanagi]